MQTNATLQVRIARKHTEAQDICSLELVPLDGHSLPAFTAGAHIDLHLPGGLVRQYSLCNDPADAASYVVGVLRDAASRGGSAAVHEQLGEGQQITIGAPRNLFALHAGRPARHLLLAGGIGITPILAMARQLAREGADFELHYCARSRDRMAFAGLLQSMPWAGQVHLHLDDEAANGALDMAALLGRPQQDLHLYVCGPRGFMDAALDQARASGWEESRLHYEFFAGEAAVREGDAGFEVEVASTGQVVRVAPEQTVVQALAAIGVEVQTSCEQGVCGTCLTRVLSGQPEHRDMYLTEDEQAACDQFLPCCSRAKSSRLVLDL
ncbi:Phthalate dioxygenase reductase [Delftia tsuruhatensis]|uniref:PDR/VanB family oxidoreductase n=1 Tax=Delftia tsuruhatensis TaxID=180282 RepID=UPI001E819D65|nr:PDR/VanB family oxidoreductase [Delftia tsuruhatensis]CAB5713384.1 Phthalate dioxygenase reductase [Delftia tsuruhatensis]CAC9692017.1 Phthalate dioxygenase reductase [Delftia tsuruhatensis]